VQADAGLERRPVGRGGRGHDGVVGHHLCPAIQFTLETSGITSLLPGKARRLPLEVPLVTVGLQAVA
jgi:hypothetical protein